MDIAGSRVTMGAEIQVHTLMHACVCTCDIHNIIMYYIYVYGNTHTPSHLVCLTGTHTSLSLAPSLSPPLPLPPSLPFPPFHLINYLERLFLPKQQLFCSPMILLHR